MFHDTPTFANNKPSFYTIREKMSGAVEAFEDVLDSFIYGGEATRQQDLRNASETKDEYDGLIYSRLLEILICIRTFLYK